MTKTALLSSGAILMLGLALPCAAASLPSIAPAQVTALPAVTATTAALPALPSAAVVAPASRGLGRAVNRRESLPGLDGMESSSVKPVQNISIRPIRVPPGIVTPPLSASLP